jgi:hypothetical protein
MCECRSYECRHSRSNSELRIWPLHRRRDRECVLRQRAVPVEHVIQDAGSSDETIELLERFGNRVVWTSEHWSIGRTEQGAREAISTRIAWLNADEFYLPAR